MYRFLATRRWLVRTVAGLLLVVVFVRLGLWQLDRNEERAQRNETVEANVDASAVPLEELLPSDEPFDAGDEWRPVQVRGRYDVDQQLLLRLRPLDGEPGVHVVTPLVTASGAALLVDRGFYPTAEQVPEDVPLPPAGDIRLTARLRVTEEQDVGADLSRGLVRSMNVDGIGQVLPHEVYPAWAEAVDPVDSALVAIPRPTPDAGPHLSYAVQWFIFAIVGVTGFVFLVRAEAKGRRQADVEGSPANGGEFSLS